MEHLADPQTLTRLAIYPYGNSGPCPPHRNPRHIKPRKRHSRSFEPGPTRCASRRPLLFPSVATACSPTSPLRNPARYAHQQQLLLVINLKVEDDCSEKDSATAPIHLPCRTRGASARHEAGVRSSLGEAVEVSCAGNCKLGILTATQLPRLPPSR